MPVVIASGIAAADMLSGALILRCDPSRDDGTESLTIKAVLLDIIAAAAARRGRGQRRDHPRRPRLVLARPATALAIAVIISYHAQNSPARQ